MWLVAMTRSCTRQPSAQPAVATCSRRRRGTTIARAANNGAKTRPSEVEAAAANARTAATAAPARVRGRHSAAQNSPTSRYQMVLTPLSAISSCATGSSTTDRPSMTRSHRELTMPSLA